MSGKYTQEQITEIIKKWADAKSKSKADIDKIEFDETFCGGSVVRFKTVKMTSLIPNNTEGKHSGFDDGTRPDHYAYEIECLVTKLKLRLAVNYQNMPDETKKICEVLLEKYKMMPYDDVTLPTQFRRICIYDIDIEDCQDQSSRDPGCACP